MKIRISRQILTEALYKLQGVVSQRSTLAILSNALLEAKDDVLTLHATDLDISISTSCPCEVLTPGGVTLQAKGLFDIVKSLQDDTLELETEDNYWAQIKSGSVNCRVVGTHPDDFPQVPNLQEAKMYPIGTQHLLDMIEKTLFSISTDDARANLTGAFFKVTDHNTLLMVSTDGHRLSKIETAPDVFDVTADIPDALRQGIIIPRKGLNELKRTVNAKSDKLAFGLLHNSAVFRYENTTLTISLIEGTFPDFTQVLPQESDKKAILHRDTLVQSLRFVSLFASAKTANVRIALTEDGMELYASDPDKGEGKKVVPVEYDGLPVKAGYNYKYLLDVLNALDGDEVSMEVIDTLSPTLVRDPSRAEMLFVVMPMRL